ncbi:phosphonate utilization associated putative membrane protein [Fusobacterium necrogenes]|uniref:Phosphonate utilization associated putative membrane protein n=1 Tax=Fusobacterium necrogenes TaxID=858 RepID=A0A377GYJ8_9FUSO|nr:EamA family transporter [Fusobacterium necrogenes]STO31654.1 phosphonate utilization associated putative membrane protein [Fusobacterium necrogenes]
MWFFYAVLSAIFAALTSILAKIGMGEISSNLATAIRTSVVLFMAWGMVLFTKTGNQIESITGKEWLFLVLSGLATGASWLCYYKALQIGEVSKVVPVDKFSIVITILFAFIFLKEVATLKVILGAIFITIGTFIMIL